MYQERHLTEHHKSQVAHSGAAGDLILNTAQMRDTIHVQQFHIPFQALDEDSIIQESVAREVVAQKQARRTGPGATHMISTPNAGSAAMAGQFAGQRRRLVEIQILGS